MGRPTEADLQRERAARHGESTPPAPSTGGAASEPPARDPDGEVLAQDAVGGSPGDADLEQTAHRPRGVRSEDD